MKRGDIILIAVPFSDLTSTKVRPALVVSPENPAEGDFVVALITTNIDRAWQSFSLLKSFSPEKIGESVARAYEKT